MTHFTRKQFVAFLGLLPPGHVQEYPKHDATDDAHILALPACGNPPQFVPYYDAKVYFIGAHNRARGREGSSHPVTISRMNMCGQIFERDFFASCQAPKIKGLIIHPQLVSIDVP